MRRSLAISTAAFVALGAGSALAGPSIELVGTVPDVTLFSPLLAYNATTDVLSITDQSTTSFAIALVAGDPPMELFDASFDLEVIVDEDCNATAASLTLSGTQTEGGDVEVLLEASGIVEAFGIPLFGLTADGVFEMVLEVTGGSLASAYTVDTIGGLEGTQLVGVVAGPGGVFDGDLSNDFRNESALVDVFKPLGVLPTPGVAMAGIAGFGLAAVRRRR